MAHVIDYAGLFPPAGLDMRTAVANFASYLESADSWMLGRFIVPLRRAGELAEAKTAIAPAATWQVSILCGLPSQHDTEQLVNIVKESARAGCSVTSIEAAAKNGDEIRQCIASLPRRSALHGSAPAQDALDNIAMFIEIPLDAHVRENLAAILAGGCFAKVRTGGITADAFPPAATLAEFILSSAQNGVRWKATAGLHHPIRGSYRLTYEAGSPRGTMYGYLNVLLAAAMAFDVAVSGSPAGIGRLIAVLEETSVAAFGIGAKEITYGGKTFAAETLARMRRAGMASFGSCSFTEPVEEIFEKLN
jgi:hypothetical protein